MMHHVMQFIEEELQSPSGRQHSRMGRNGKWIPPLDLVSKITDYEELKFARQTAREARRFSVIAIEISFLALIASVVTPILVAQFMSQTVQVDQGQFEILKSAVIKTK